VKILVFGAGFLGWRFTLAFPGAVMSLTDIANHERVEETIRAERPDAVINCAGKTGRPNVDWCETHQLETVRSNVTGPLVLAEACAAAKVYMLHMGSGCVFYGPGPWHEYDHANPTSVYSRTKYAADLALSELPDVGIVRLRMPIDDQPGLRNLITKLAGYKHVIDVENSVTVVEDLIHVVRELIERRAEGIFHATNPGTVRHRDLLRLYREIVDPTHDCEFIAEDELVRRGLVASVRSNAILASSRLESLGIEMRPVAAALRDVMTQYARHIATSGSLP